MAVHPEHTLAPEIGRRAFLGGTAGALAAIAIPAAAVAAGNPAAEPDWQALHDELQSAGEAVNQACAELIACRAAAEAAYPQQNLMMPAVAELEEGAGWVWLSDQRHPALDHFSKLQRTPQEIETHFTSIISEAALESSRGEWPEASTAAFIAEGERLRHDCLARYAAWRNLCDEVDQLHGLAKARAATDLAIDRREDIEDAILETPVNSLAGAFVKLAIALRYSNADDFSTEIMKSLCHDLGSATGLPTAV